MNIILQPALQQRKPVLKELTLDIAKIMEGKMIADKTARYLYETTLNPKLWSKLLASVIQPKNETIYQVLREDF